MSSMQFLFERPESDLVYVLHMTLTKEQELWAMALWVEKNHGSEGAAFIANRLAELVDEPDGLRMWLEVAERFEALSGAQVRNGRPLD
jgi:hypothetical protein